MKITLLTIGKTEDKYLLEGIEIYLKRLKHYISFRILEVPELKGTKNLSQDQQKTKEAELIFKNINSTDYVVLLDENGLELSSKQFSMFLNKKMVGGQQHLVFVVGGPYGFSEEVYKRSGEKISLSRMTFSHQMIRLFFTEQLYRAYTILRGEPYHHD
ncbi:23S rRNA (pseudouridine(1915)-N(3))-methyltransferase RlmH [Daejeonella lutea]|uniref:Ribosomal RNA large subunit methyltransferase H n=1 Tax=Daejeonella lutea TaxID=572036 RepID=A0A1T5C2T0_9SPHI|nr:23S rRNA (pseudouridine(1915)-N(3))-methyltransferase RlmH [Daejeonella lutea]SKB53430.1 23S rRNA (pseudouridine1915-N3)-methyltransferase [Daejeonella lutea]